MDHKILDNRTAEALRKSSVARYLQLSSLFRRRIETGEWPVDSKIPTVKELADQCGVASMTIRQALDLLEADGLIERFRAKGTFVKKQPQRDLWCKVHTDWTGLLLARENAVIEILSVTSNVPWAKPARALVRTVTCGLISRLGTKLVTRRLESMLSLK